MTTVRYEIRVWDRVLNRVHGRDLAIVDAHRIVRMLDVRNQGSIESGQLLRALRRDLGVPDASGMAIASALRVWDSVERRVIAWPFAGALPPASPPLPDEVWVTEDGRRIRVVDMDESHVRNALRLVLRRDREHRERVARTRAGAFDHVPTIAPGKTRRRVPLVSGSGKITL